MCASALRNQQRTGGALPRGPFGPQHWKSPKTKRTEEVYEGYVIDCDRAHDKASSKDLQFGLDDVHINSIPHKGHTCRLWRMRRGFGVSFLRSCICHPGMSLWGQVLYRPPSRTTYHEVLGIPNPKPQEVPVNFVALQKVRASPFQAV